MHYLISQDIAGPIALANGERYSFAIVPVANYGEANLVIISDIAPTAATIQTAINARANAKRILAIKAEAQDRIYAILPQWKQANLTASSVYLQSLKSNDTANRQAWIASGSNVLTEPAKTYTATEEAQWNGMLVLFARTKAIRTHSDALEADPNLTPAWPT